MTALALYHAQFLAFREKARHESSHFPIAWSQQRTAFFQTSSYHPGWGLNGPRRAVRQAVRRMPWAEDRRMLRSWTLYAQWLCGMRHLSREFPLNRWRDGQRDRAAPSVPPRL